MKNDNITLSHKDKISLLSNFSTMLGAGISILESVDSLLEDAKGNPRKVLQALREDLIQGKHVYACFSKFPQVFDKVTVNIIKAAEQAGTLDVTLLDIKNHLQKEMEFMDKVRAAMIYPIMIFIVFIAVMLGILIFVIPRMASVFTRMKVELPLPTKIMITVSDFILSNYVGILIGLAVGIVGLIFIYKRKKSILTNILFSMPLVSNLVKEMDLTRFSQSMSLLLRSGLTITQALELCQEIVWRRDVSALIKHTHTVVMSGKRVSEGLRNGKGIFPVILIKIVEAGEKTGSLDKSLQDIGEYMDYQVSRTLATLTSLLEPVMLIFIGIVVGGMMMSIIAPIYGMIGQINRR